MAQALAILVVSCATAASQEEGGELAQSLILAASPFVHREGWQPSALAQRLLLSSRKALHKEQEDIGISGEVRETGAASEGRQTARRGKSLYSPGPAAIRREYGQTGRLGDTHFLKSVDNHIYLKQEKEKSETFDHFWPVEGSTKTFPSFLLQQDQEKEFSQPEDEANTNLWTPHLSKPLVEINKSKERSSLKKSFSHLPVKESSSSITKSQLQRFKELLRRKKKIRTAMLKSVKESGRRDSSIDSVILENGEPKIERVQPDSFDDSDMPFLVGDKNKLQRQKRKGHGEEPRDQRSAAPPETRDEQMEGADSLLTFAHIPPTKETRGDYWSPHSEVLPTFSYHPSHGHQQGLPKGVVRGQDGRLRIPIKLDAHLSIPEFQQDFSNIFKNYSPSINFHSGPAPVEQHKEVDHTPVYHSRDKLHENLPKVSLETLFSMALLGQSEETGNSDSGPGGPIYRHSQELYTPPESRPGYRPPASQPKEAKPAYQPPPPYQPPKLPPYTTTDAGSQELYGPHVPKQNYQPPRNLYSPPSVNKPHSKPEKHSPYEPPTPKPSYQPPSRAYIPPPTKPSYESRKKEAEHGLPPPSYSPPSQKLEKYKAPKKERPSTLYTTPTPNYDIPLQIKGEYSLPKLKTTYEPPTSLYELPTNSEEPQEKYKPTAKHAMVTQGIYKATDIHHHGFASLLGPKRDDAYEVKKKLSADVYHITPHGSYGPLDKSLVKELPLLDGYTYQTPTGYTADANPTFPKKQYKEPKDTYEVPKSIYKEPKKELEHKYKSQRKLVFPMDALQGLTSKPGAGYKPPYGYDYSPPHGFEPEDNPTFPTKYEAGGGGNSEGIHPPDGYEYRAPPGYSPSDNPTFPTKPQLQTGYVVPKNLEEHKVFNERYQPPSKSDEPVQYTTPPYSSHLSHIHDPTYPTQQGPYDGLSYSYSPAPEGRTTGAAKHSFNIIIKNKNKPDTKLRISPEGQYGPPGESEKKPRQQGPTSPAKLPLKGIVPAVPGARETPRHHLSQHLQEDTDTLFRVDLSHQEAPQAPQPYSPNMDTLITELLVGTEQLLFSFIVPSTFCSTDNINELQKLVTQGCNKLQRKLLFADSLAKLPYKIGAIRGILSNLVNALQTVKESNANGGVTYKDISPTHELYIELQRSTEGLCRGHSSLPVLAVDLQKSCDLLQDAKVVTVFNMIAVPCFVYQGAVGLLGERLYMLGGQ